MNLAVEIFKMIERLIKTPILNRLGQKKAILILGPRQTGKTTLAKSILANHPGKALYLNADEPFDRSSGRGTKSLTVCSTLLN